MALFGKKLSTVEDILNAIEALSEEDKAKVAQALETQAPAEEPAPETEETESDADEAAENEGPAVDAPEESAETEEGEPSEDPVAQEEPIEETIEPPQPEAMPEESVAEGAEQEGEQVPDAGAEDASNALSARIDALEALLDTAIQRLDTLTANIDRSGNFGRSPATPTSEEPEGSEDDRVMRGYYGKNYQKFIR